MRMPGFSGGSSLYTSTYRYRRAATPGGVHRPYGVSAQLKGGGFHRPIGGGLFTIDDYYTCKQDAKPRSPRVSTPAKARGRAPSRLATAGCATTTTGRACGDARGTSRETAAAFGSLSFQHGDHGGGTENHASSAPCAAGGRSPPVTPADLGDNRHTHRACFRDARASAVASG